jgi:hypothetical protein
MIAENSDGFGDGSSIISTFLGSATVPVAPVGVPPTSGYSIN